MTLAQIAAIIQLLLAFNVPQPTVDTVQAILNASLPGQTIELSSSTPAVASAPAPAIVTVMPEPTPFALYQLTYEPGLQDFYYAGNKELASVTVNGEDAMLTSAKYLSTSCIVLPDTSRVCGYWMTRFTATKGDSNAVVLTALDGTSHSTII